MVPKDLIDYFTTSAAVAGTLIGLLFVSITLRYEVVFGAAVQQRGRSLAGAAFVALANSLAVSLWALLPHTNLGEVAIATGTLGGAFTLYNRRSRGATSLVVFAVSMGNYTFQLVVGALLISTPGDHNFALDLAYSVFAALVAGLIRAWELLQVEVQVEEATENGHNGASPSSGGTDGGM